MQAAHASGFPLRAKNMPRLQQNDLLSRYQDRLRPWSRIVQSRPCHCGLLEAIDLSRFPTDQFRTYTPMFLSIHASIFRSTTSPIAWIDLPQAGDTASLRPHPRDTGSLLPLSDAGDSFNHDESSHLCPWRGVPCSNLSYGSIVS